MESITNITDAKLLAFQSILEHYAQDHVSILLSLAHLQSLHNQHICQYDVPTNNERIQKGIQFFLDVIEITIR